ncbi:hypothetical protein EXIGLDRAFT_755649 [Exidia glandulosa HHB12029]|uniref:MFS general substrate transporter n=1 Tax=Exidia glandulosa HHB12029 TaxID=1314781 RepID=A0A165ZBY9_EXIGL|nr:hypothetical protein EXIGLDRAFT_755649 [Exidia glandulosa HHB12029]
MDDPDEATPGPGLGSDERAENDETTQSRLMKIPRRPSLLWALPIFGISAFVAALRAAAMSWILFRLACRIAHPTEDPWSLTSSRAPILTLNLILREPLSYSVGLRSESSPNETQGPNIGGHCNLMDPYFGNAYLLFLTLPASILILNFCGRAWWGHRADIWGRNAVIAVCAAATAIHDVNLLLVYRFFPPGAFIWLLPGTLIAGLLGGTLAESAMLAYLVDCTPPKHRSAILSFNAGVGFAAAGLAFVIGQKVASLSEHPSTPILISIAWSSIMVLLWNFVVPESLAHEIREVNAQETMARDTGTTAQSGRSSRVGQGLRSLVQPLRMIKPPFKNPQDPSIGNDYTLIKIAGILILVLASSHASSSFLFSWLLLLLRSLPINDWNETGFLPWPFCRAGLFILIFPGLIYLCQKMERRDSAVALSGPDDRLLETAAAPDPQTGTIPDDSHPPVQTATSWSDLSAIRILVVCSALSYATSFIPGAYPFISNMVGLALSAGILPCAQSLGLAVFPARETHVGTFFGAFSVVVELGLILPAVLNYIISSLLEMFRHHLFIVLLAIVWLFLSYLLSMFVRRPRM